MTPIGEAVDTGKHGRYRTQACAPCNQEHDEDLVFDRFPRGYAAEDLPGHHAKRRDHAYDRKRDCYICRAGKELRQRQKIYRVPRPLIDENGMTRYRASKVGLRVLFAETAVLSERACPENPALHP